MTTRLFIFLSISALIHAIALVQPWSLFFPAGDFKRPSVSVPVRLVDEIQPEEPVGLKDESREQPVEGVSLQAEGEVSADYLDLLKVRIFESWDYPGDAIAMGADGVVKLWFVLDHTGSVMTIDVLGGSGHDSLDAAAVDAVLKAAPFGPFTEDIAGKTLKITGSFCYVLD